MQNTPILFEEAKSSKRYLTINMPQMALEALSENWLFKELGDVHWDLICKGLNTKSFDLKNDLGNRLYATFVRIRISCSNTLKSFNENEPAVIDGTIKRFGNSMYFSDILFQSGKESVKAELMTTFSIRDKVDNTKLAKSEPDLLKNNVAKLASFPSFGNEYRLIKKKILKEIGTDENKFIVEDKFIYETEYALNPYYDLNGVNLLYFAAYPIINDVCEAKFFNEKEFTTRWEQEYYTAYKDVLYYSNCNIFDTILYQLVSFEDIGNGQIKISSILRRKSDQVIIARIFTVKKKILS